jgi:hypothetical protein
MASMKVTIWAQLLQLFIDAGRLSEALMCHQSLLTIESEENFELYVKAYDRGAADEYRRMQFDYQLGAAANERLWCEALGLAIPAWVHDVETAADADRTSRRRERAASQAELAALAADVPALQSDDGTIH